MSLLSSNIKELRCSFRIKSAWIDGIKGKFKRGRRTATSHVDVVQSISSENAYDRLSGDDERSNERLTKMSSGRKRSRHSFEVDSDEEHYETGEMPRNTDEKESVCLSFILRFVFLFTYLRIK